MKKDMLELADRLKALRETTGKTQEEFAEDSGLDRSYYGRIENGKVNPTVGKLLRVLEINGIKPDKFFEGWKENKIGGGLSVAEKTHDDNA